MGGVLNFTLGLENAEFIEKMGISEKVMVSFEAVFESLKTAAEKSWQAVEKGAALQGLHARTGQSAGSLYQLQQAFTAVEVGADAVGGMLFKTQKFLGGMTEEGEKTDEILQRIGLNFADLKKLDAGNTFQVIAEALAKLDPNTAAAVAAKLYGREGAGNMIQIANSSKEFREAMEASAKDGAIWQAAAPAFHAIAMSAGIIKSHLGTLWVGVAQGLAPVITKLQHLTDGINFASIAGGITKAFYEVEKLYSELQRLFKEGNLGMFLVEEFHAGMFLISTQFDLTLAQMGLSLMKAFEQPLMALEVMFEYAFSRIAHNPAMHAILDALTHGLSSAVFAGADAASPGFKNSNFMQLALERGKQGFGFGTLNLDAALEELKKTKGAAWEVAMQEFGKIKDKYHLDLSVLDPAGEKDKTKKPGAIDPGDTKHDKPRFTELEKIGFVIASGGGRGDFASHTAQNTRETAQGIKETNGLLREQNKLLAGIHGNTGDMFTNAE